MQDASTVYWVGTRASSTPAPWGGSTVAVLLLRGNQLMRVDGVSHMEHDTTQDDLDCLWEEGGRITNLSDADAAAWFAQARELEEDQVALAHEAGMDAYLEDADENPYDEILDPTKHDAWNEGWMAAFAGDTGREYDAQDEAEREAEQERADEEASKLTMARWWHEEHAVH